MKKLLRPAFIGSSLCLIFSSGILKAETAPDGAELYHDFCSVCHGDRGDGKSRASGGLKPPPRDFTNDKAKQELTRDRMIFAATYGRPNTAMVGWGTRLNEEQIGSIVDYIRGTFMGISDDTPVVEEQPEEAPATDNANAEEYAEATDPEFFKQPMPYGLSANLDWGKLFYEETCAECHGVDGDGLGPRSKFIMPKPRNFKHPASRAKYNRPKIFELVNSGSHGSEMPAWDKVLTHQEIAHVTEYIFETFIQVDETN